MDIGLSDMHYYWQKCAPLRYFCTLAAIWTNTVGTRIGRLIAVYKSTFQCKQELIKFEFFLDKFGLYSKNANGQKPTEKLVPICWKTADALEKQNYICAYCKNPAGHCQRHWKGYSKCCFFVFKFVRIFFVYSCRIGKIYLTLVKEDHR